MVSDEEEFNLTTPRKQQKKSYTQKFKKEWQQTFGNWLQENNKQPFCRACQKFIKGGVTHIERHRSTTVHEKNIKKLTGTPKINTVLQDPAKTKLRQQIKEGELKLCMFLHEHNLPFLIMDHLPKLISSVCPDSNIAKELHCSRTKATQITKQCLAVESIDSIKEHINRVPAYSLIIDETTDVGSKKSLAIVVRYFDKNVQNTKDRFLGLLEVREATAQALFDSIVKFLNDNGIEIDKLIGLGADNAAVMMGQINGVRAKFEEIRPDIFILGCVCHSFHLCSSSAANKLPKSIEQFVRNVYNYFAHSSKRIESLKEFQDFVQLKNHKMLKPSQTRWLSFQSCIDRILEQWNALTLFFAEAAFTDNLLVSIELDKALKTPVYKMYLLFLSYILEIVNKLNIEFQSEKPKIHLLNKRIADLYRSILRNYMKLDYLKKTDMDKIEPSNPTHFLPLENIYLGAKYEVEIKKNTIEASELKKMKLSILEFYIELSLQIKQRFPFNDEKLKFLEKFSPEICLSGEVISIASDATNIFPSITGDIGILDSEWRLLADTTELKSKKNLDLYEFWCHIFQMKNSMDSMMFPALSNLMMAILSLPHSSAAAERIFSQLNLIKTKSRNRLEVKTCDAILHAKELSYETDCFDWSPTINLMKKNVKYE